MLISGIHWLGLYYIVKVENENYTNMEPEKHEEVARIPKEQLPKMLHEDLIKQAMLSNENSSRFVNSLFTNPKSHTM